MWRKWLTPENRDALILCFLILCLMIVTTSDVPQFVYQQF